MLISGLVLLQPLPGLLGRQQPPSHPLAPCAGVDGDAVEEKVVVTGLHYDEPGHRFSVCRRLHRRYERKPEHFLAFTAIAATLICHRRLTK